MFQVTIIGNLGANAEVKESEDKKKYSSFRVAASTGFGDNQETTWVSVRTTYRENLHQYLTKGTQVFVQGDGRINLFTTRDNKTAAGVSVYASTLQLLGSKTDAKPEAQKPVMQQLGAVEHLRQQQSGDQTELPF